MKPFNSSGMAKPKLREVGDTYENLTGNENFQAFIASYEISLRE